MRYTALALLPVLALAACATPRQQCDRAAVQDRDTVGALIIETEQNLARGYAIETELRTQPRFQFCYGHHPNGNVGMVLCNSTDAVEVERPVAIDTASEKAKLKSLRERYAVLSEEADRALAQCAQNYP